MGTLANRVQIYLKKFLTQQHMTSNFLDYLRGLTLDVMADMFPFEGFFYGGTLSGDGSNKFKISTPHLATDGLGHRLVLPADEASGIAFENALGVSYHVGLRYNEIPNLTELNVRTGQIEYALIQERIGEIGEPNSVTDNGATLTFRVDNVCESGVSNSGRKCLVWLKRAVGQADAFFEGTVSFSGGQNKLTTTHLLGQQAGAIDTAVSSYQVFLIGPTVRRNTNLNNDPLYAYLGTVTGAGSGNQPSSFVDGKTLLLSPGFFTTIANETKSFLVGGGLVTWNLTTQTLTWAAAMKVIIPHKSYSFTVDPASVASLAANELLYFMMDNVGGTKTLTKTTIGSVPDDPNAYVVVVRHVNDLYFKNGALELKGDADSATSGRINDITQDLMTFMGATDESDSAPHYETSSDPNTIVAEGDPLATAINKLNSEAIAVATNNPNKEIFESTLNQTVFNLTKFQVDTDNTVEDVMCFIDGRWQPLCNVGDFSEGSFRKNGLTQCEVAEAVPAGKKVIFFKLGTAYGGQYSPSAGNIWSDPMDASIVPSADAVHSIGSDIRRVNEVRAKTVTGDFLIHRIAGIGDIKRIKVMVNGDTALIPKRTPIAKYSDGKIYFADSDSTAGKKFIGWTLEDIDVGESGLVFLVGPNLPDFVAGMGFVPGDEIFIGETGGTMTNNPGSFSGVDDDIIKIGVADCSEGVASGMATDLIQTNDVVARA